MSYILLISSIIIIAVALSYFVEKNKKKKNKFNKKVNAHNTNLQNQKSDVFMINCPLCNFPLKKGENLVSKVYRPMDVPDQRCTINGCPHCFPRIESNLRRICPCCKKEVPLNGYLIARLFNYKDNKKHVRITGCSECLKK